MGFLDKLLKKKKSKKKAAPACLPAVPAGRLAGTAGGQGEPQHVSDAVLKIKEIVSVTSESVKVVFDVPEELQLDYTFLPGQYVNVIVPIDGKDEHRSYSICSAVREPLAIGVKKVEKGVVSTYFNEDAKAGDDVSVSFPLGGFTLSSVEGKYVAIAAGSGITPVLSIAKFIEKSEKGHLNLFYGNSTEGSIMFNDDLKDISKEALTMTHSLSKEEKEGYNAGRLNEENLTAFIKKDLGLLKAEGFYICGPEDMIIGAQNVLQKFGVAEDKIHYELFTTPTKMESNTKENMPEFDGVSKVTVILDEEEETFDLNASGDTILGEAESHGIDAPYSCRGAICCTCKAKVLKGTAVMDKNFTLTDSEIDEGYVLTCQAHPNTEEVTISYDE